MRTLIRFSMLLKARAPRFTRVAPILLLLSVPLVVRAESRSAMTTQATPVYVEPSEQARVLGNAPADYRLLLDLPAQNGWYRVRFSRPWKGQSVAWVKTTAVRLVGNPAGAPEGRSNSFSERSARKSRPGRGWVSAGLLYQGASPSAYQQSLAEPVQAVKVAGYGIDTGYRLSSDFAFALSVRKLSLTGNYFLNGYAGELFGLLTLLDRGFVSLMAGPGLGASFLTIGNTSVGEDGKVQLIQTSGVMELIFSGRLLARVCSPHGLGLDVLLGYSKWQASDIPGIQAGKRTNATVALSGLHYGAQLSFSF